MLEIIPAIDLMHGHAVGARKGRRSRYQPLKSCLSTSSAPHEVVSGLLQLFPFRTLYIADLDAILGRGHNRIVIRRLQQKFPQLEIWLDSGIRNNTELKRVQSAQFGRPVIGTETLIDIGLFKHKEDLSIDSEVILSLDYKGKHIIGPSELEWNINLWPENVILMSLARIGSDKGPDLDRLQKLRQCSPGTTLYAAGGVRHPSDLANLCEMGVKGVLIASALHDGRLNAEDITAFSRR